MKSLKFIAIFLILLSQNSFADLKLTPWSEKVFDQIEKEFGGAASKRMRNIYQLILDNEDKPVRVKLEVANNALNALPWITDREKWNADDYWATPFETLTQFGGDCEDMAIGKFMVLRLMGIPKKNLYLAYVKVKQTGETHMVLVWTNDSRSEYLVLDNLNKTIKSGKERTDLIAVYLTDADGKIILIQDDGKKRNIKAEFKPKKFQKLETVKQRMRENQEKYKKINDGRPLF